MNTPPRLPALKPLACALSLAVYGPAALGQMAVLEEVIVTATKRSESLQDIPVTVNAFDSETILEAGINSAQDVAVLTPSLNINTNISPFNSRMTIRGIGTAQTDPSLEPSVGLFVDGVFMGRTGLGMSDLTDIQRIEVLQGPQGTLYGKNTNAGAISVITKAPNLEELEGYLDLGVGNYGMGRATGAVSGPISDTVAYRVSGSMHKRDGYYENRGGADLSDADDWNIQGKLLWEPTDDLSFQLSASHIERDNNCCGADAVQSDIVNEELVAQGFAPDLNDPYDYKVAVDEASKFEMESDLAALTIGYVADWGTITSITAWNDYDYVTTTDADRSQLDVLSVIDDVYGGDSLSQELRLTSEAGDSFEYQVGLFYYEQTTTRGDGSPFVFIGDDFIGIASQLGLPFPAPVPFLVAAGDNLEGKNKWETETIALFGQATWHIGDAWHLTGGLRWSDEEKRASLYTQINSTAPSQAILGRSLLNFVSEPIDADFERQADNVDWLVRLSRDIGDSSMLFASAGTGTKSGGFNGVNGGLDGPEDREFDDEFTTSYEIGVKSNLLDNRMRLNASAFYTVAEDYQQQQQLDTGAGTFVSNEAEIETSGVDVDFAAAVLPNLTLTAGLLYMHDYEITDGPQKGNPLPFTADITFNVGGTVVFPLADGGIFLRADYQYMDDHATNGAREDTLQPKDFDDRKLLNMNLGWRNDNWNISVWGKNLTDDEYAAQTASPFAFTGMDAYFLAPPRTYGASLRYDF